jgi:hypothetical protein
MKELELEKLFPYAENSFKEELVRFSQPVSLKKGTMVGYPGAVCELVPIVLREALRSISPQRTAGRSFYTELAGVRPAYLQTSRF